jgi:hypothetical protein
MDVPEWFSWENQGGGIAVLNLEDPRQHDLIVFMVDNAVGQNQAFYKVGKKIDINGNVVGGWSLWHGVPAWFSWENQGAGIAAMRSNGRPALSVMMVDNPPGQNEGRYRVLPLDKNPQRDGTWQLLPYNSDVLAVHAALLARGHVLFFAGSGSSKVRFESPQFSTLATSVVWDPNAPDGENFFPTNILLPADGRPYDYFCGGDSFLADGRMLFAGGTATYPFRGRADAATFNPQTRQWAFVASMARGRWYPSLITLGDGRILAASDLNEKKTMEIYSPLTNTWTLQTFADGFAGLPLYAHLFLLADGRILFDGGRMDDPLPVAPCIIDLNQNPIRTVQVPGGSQGGMRNQSASVLLPSAQDQRVMIIGGGPPDKKNPNGCNRQCRHRRPTRSASSLCACDTVESSSSAFERHLVTRSDGLCHRRFFKTGGTRGGKITGRNLRSGYEYMDIDRGLYGAKALSFHGLTAPGREGGDGRK